MTEPVERDIVDQILDKLAYYLEKDLKTDIDDDDLARVKSVTIGPLQDDQDRLSPFIELYHDEEHLDRDWHKGGSFVILRDVGGGAIWLHHFRVEVYDFRVGGTTPRGTAANRHATLRYRVKKCLLDHYDLDSVQDSFDATVAANSPNDIILFYASKSRGGENEWIWQTTFYVRYRADHT